MDDGATIGARLRVLRKWRRMTLVQLADQAQISKSQLSAIELGQRALDRRSHIAALASALRVSETDLVGGPHLSKDPVQAEPHAYIPALRVALETNSLGESLCERSRPLAELVAEVAAVDDLRVRGDLAAMGARLPAVLDELHVHTAAPVDEVAYRTALETMLDACVCGLFVAKNLGYGDLAHLAARRAAEAAAVLGRPEALGVAAFTRVLTVSAAPGARERALKIAENAAEALEPHARRRRGVEVLGLLTLNAALTAASLNRIDRAHQWLARADELAMRVPDTPADNWQHFSATNVAVWRVAVDVEFGHMGGKVRELAQRVEIGRLAPLPFRRAGFLADVGRGLARDPKTRGQAVEWLRQAENSAPQMIRNNIRVRETVAVMLEQARAAAGGRELRGMAARMGVPH